MTDKILANKDIVYYIDIKSPKHLLSYWGSTPFLNLNWGEPIVRGLCIDDGLKFTSEVESFNIRVDQLNVLWEPWDSLRATVKERTIQRQNKKRRGK